MPSSSELERLPSLLPELLELHVPVLERLTRLRELGWRDEGLDGHFQRQRHTADNSDERHNTAWFRKMKVALGELDRFERFVPLWDPVKFLDLGCCPGGFSSYILKSNPQACGVGISLPEHQGGHPFTLEPDFRSRYEFHSADLLYYQLHPDITTASNGAPLHQLPPSVNDGQFDLILLDGHQLRTYQGPEASHEDQAQAWDRQRLLIGQIVIALRAVKHGGTFVIKMSHPEHSLTALLLLFLDMVSKKLAARKPRTIHANRGTFYAIAQGVGMGSRGDELAEFRGHFEDLWYEISFGGEEGKGRWLGKRDFDFIMDEEEMVREKHLRRIVELARDPWIVQADALHNWFRQKRLL